MFTPKDALGETFGAQQIKYKLLDACPPLGNPPSLPPSLSMGDNLGTHIKEIDAYRLLWEVLLMSMAFCAPLIRVYSGSFGSALPR